MSNNFNQLFKLLKKPPPGSVVFNPWFDYDNEHEMSSDGAEIRRRQLHQYLMERLETVRYLLLGEAIGYQGGHFSGIPMTSERILLGHLEDNWVTAAHVFKMLAPQRTSKISLKPKGFSEPTATIVWQKLLEVGFDPYSWVFWNAFPWHPYQQNKGLLSNRTPTAEELKAGLPVLRLLLDIFPQAKIIAMGNKAAMSLKGMKKDYWLFRHPANGGASIFAKQLDDFYNFQLLDQS